MRCEVCDEVITTDNEETTTCDVCGKTMHENCAIERDGYVFCSTCNIDPIEALMKQINCFIAKRTAILDKTFDTLRACVEYPPADDINRQYGFMRQTLIRIQEILKAKDGE